MAYKNILLTGGSGKLGRAIQESGCFPGILAPARAALDITKPATIGSFLSGHPLDAIIHCAAMARMGECEKDPGKAFETNVVGTGNLVTAVLRRGQGRGGIRFIHISTDAVYPGTRGNYSEAGETIPYNTYGWTKLGAECAVRMLPNYCIIRTSFFDPENIPYEDSPTDSFSSKVPLPYLVRAVAKMIEHPFVGTVNIGGERRSDYDRYREHKPSLRPCTFQDILKRVAFPIARDASMDCGVWKRIEGGE